jgi:hypothetical protein
LLGSTNTDETTKRLRRCSNDRLRYAKVHWGNRIRSILSCEKPTTCRDEENNS